MANINAVDLNLLKALDALIETRSVTRAAERLELSQPAVSGMLARLREVFGDPLFLRAQRGLLPTLRTEALAVPLKRMLAEAEALLQPATFDPATAQGTLRIAATDYAQAALVLPLLAVLRREAPGLRIAVQPVDARAFPAQLEAGGLDLALVTPEMAPDHLRARRLFEETYACILRVGHPAAAGLDLDRFCALDHAIRSHDGTRFRGATDRALEAIGRSRRVVASVPSFLVLIDLVRRSDAIALVPGRLAQDAAGIVTCPPPPAVEGFTKIAVWHERQHHDPAHAWLRQRLADTGPGPVTGGPVRR